MRGNPANKSCTKPATFRRGSTRVNRDPIRAISSSTSHCHRSRSMLWPVATAKSLLVHTTRHDHVVVASQSATTPARQGHDSERRGKPMIAMITALVSSRGADLP